MKNTNDKPAGTNIVQADIEPKTTLISRNITVQARRTSVRLEPEMWNALQEISLREGCTIHDVCTLISLRKRKKTSLTAAIRVFIMLYFRAATTEEGHKAAGHGDFQRMKRRACIPKHFAYMFSSKEPAECAVISEGNGYAPLRGESGATQARL